MAGEVYRLLCGGFDDRGGYFSSGGHDDFGTDRFQAENYVPLLYDKIYYEKYLGDLIGENMIQWGLPGILLLLWRVCLCFSPGRRSIWI